MMLFLIMGFSCHATISNSSWERCCFWSWLLLSCHEHFEQFSCRGTRHNIMYDYDFSENNRQISELLNCGYVQSPVFHVREQATANMDADLNRKARHVLQWHMQGWPVSSLQTPLRVTYCQWFALFAVRLCIEIYDTVNIRSAIILKAMKSS